MIKKISCDSIDKNKEKKGDKVSMKRKIILMFITSFVVLLSFTIVSNAGQELEQLDFNAQINADGSMDITETWDIYISHTNTLFKSFELDKNKYGDISNVKVREITNGVTKDFTQIGEEMFHVTKDCYYGLKTSSDTFEIAWGVGLDNSTDTRKYEISYTVNDAIAKYNDYAELYWQFIGEDFEIDADSITGSIYLPENAESVDDVKIWGHTEGLNGDIYVTDTNKVEFQIDNFVFGKFVEVRCLFPTEMITNSNRNYNKDIYELAVQEETKWADEANRKRDWEKSKDNLIMIGYILAVIAVSIFFITKTLKYAKKLKKLKKFKPEQKLEYFRDLPEENTSPGEAVYILEEPYNTFSSYFGKIFSATLLDLDLNGYINISVEKDEKNKDKIYISIKKEPNGKMQVDELEIYQFINKAITAKSKKKENKGQEVNEGRVVDECQETIEIKELEKYISSHSSSVVALIKKCEKQIGVQLTVKGLMKESQKKESEMYSTNAAMFFGFTIFTFVMAFPVAIILLINGILCMLIKRKINVLTQEGVNSKEKWQGLYKYMEDFSLLDEKEVPALIVWEKYLVYATAFGIADKVLKQLKTIYPNIDEMDTINTSTYMYFMYHSNFTSSFTSSINSSISSSYSSGIGGGGGFSGGGGGGRWPEAVVEEDNTVKPVFGDGEKNSLLTSCFFLRSQRQVIHITE